MELLQNTAATLRFPEAGADSVTFDKAPTVTVTRDSDSSLVLEEVEADAVEEKEVPPYWTVPLTAAQLSEVDLLTAEWTGEVDESSNTYTTYAEIVGGFVVSLLAIEEELGEEASADKLTEAREIALHRIESACGVAFRRRYAREILDGQGRRGLFLDYRRPLQILKVEIGEVALSEAAIGELTLKSSGAVDRESGWPCGVNNIVIAYAHGHTFYPAATEPIRDLAAYYLTKAPTDWNQRATSVSTELGTYALVTPGVRGASFPLPSVNAFVDQFTAPLVA